MPKLGKTQKESTKQIVPYIPLDELLYISIGVQLMARQRILPASTFKMCKWARQKIPFPESFK